MNPVGNQNESEHQPIEEAAERAMRVLRHVDRADIRAIHVVPGRRPSYDAMLRLREHAEGLDMAISGDGSVTLRQHESALTSLPSEMTANNGSSPGRAVRLHRRLEAWSTGHWGLREGVQ